MTLAVFFDLPFLATLPGRRIEPAVMAEDGTVRSGPLTLYDGGHRATRNQLAQGDADADAYGPALQPADSIHKDLRGGVCDLGYGIAPGKPTARTIVEGYMWFEAFSEDGCATGIACTPPHMGCAGLR